MTLKQHVGGVTLLVSLVVLVLAVGTNVDTRSRPRQDKLEGPPWWVAFDADYFQSLGGRLVVQGCVYRASDGSFRQDARVLDEADGVTTTIVSIGRKAMFELRSPKAEWVAAPLVLPDDGYRPVLSRSFSEIAAPTPANIDGIELYDLIPTRDGTESRVAPSLNFYPVVTYSPAQQVRQWLTNIVIREQDAALFQPPEGAAVTWSATPRPLGSFKVRREQPAR